MLKALAWKEYREQRQVALIGLLASAMLPALFIALGAAMRYPFNPRDLVFMSAYTGAVLVWPIFATVAGAATNLREAHVGSLGFLLSRPVSRARIWAVKVGLGLISLATVIVGSVVIFWAIARLSWGPGIASGTDSPSASDVGFLAGFLCLAFACSVLYATLAASALVAAGAGLVTSLAIHAFVYGFWAIVDLWRGYERVSMIEIGLVTLMVFAGSIYAFTRGELLRGPRVRRMVLSQAVIALGVLFALSSTFAFALTRVNLSNAIFTYPALSPRGDGVVVRANRANVSAEQIWLIDLEGNAVQLTGRGSRDPAFSPDGEWVAYSVLSFFYGYPPVRLDLRLARTDGSEDRRLGRSVGWFPVFSPDGTKLAVAFWDELGIAHLDRDEVEVIELPWAFDSGGSQRVRWTPDGEELLLLQRPANSNRTLVFYHLESGDLRVFDPPHDWMSGLSYSLPADRPVPARMPVTGYWRVKSSSGTSFRRAHREYGVGLVDRNNLGGEILVRGICRPVTVDLSADERFLVYSACDERDLAQPEYLQLDSTVRLRDLESGEDRLLTTLGGNISSLMFNPSGTQVLVSTDYFGLPHGVAVVGIDGEVRTFGNFMSSVGWIDERRALLVRHPDPNVPGEDRAGSYLPHNEVLSLIVLDIDSGEQRTVFSR